MMNLVLALFLLLAPLAAQAQPAGAMKASEIVGMEITNRSTGASGRIDDLVVDIANGRVHFVMLDMEGPLVTQPMGALRFEDGRASTGAARDWRFGAQEGIALVRASHLIGLGFESERGERLGTIAELVVQPASGEVPFAAVRLREDPQRLRAVPLDAFRLSASRRNLLFVLQDSALLATLPFTAAQLAAGLDDPRFVQHQAGLAEQLTPASAAAGR